MMINIDLDTLSDPCSCTFKCFRAVKLYKNRSVSRTVLSLVSIKTANIPEIHKALYSAG